MLKLEKQWCTTSSVGNVQQLKKLKNECNGDLGEDGKEFIIIPKIGNPKRLAKNWWLWGYGGEATNIFTSNYDWLSQ